MLVSGNRDLGFQLGFLDKINWFPSLTPLHPLTSSHSVPCRLSSPLRSEVDQNGSTVDRLDSLFSWKRLASTLKVAQLCCRVLESKGSKGVFLT